MTFKLKLWQVVAVGIALYLAFGVALTMAADTEAQRIWSKSLGSAVNTVDTDEYGDNVYAGLANGSVLCYSKSGALEWNTGLNASVLKIKKAPASEYLVAMTALNESVLIDSSTGNRAGYLIGIPAVDGNIKDVDIARDGQYSFTLFDNSMYIRYGNTYYAANQSNMAAGTGGVFASSPWLNASYAPYQGWVAAGKVANATLFKFILSGYPGWAETNVAHSAPSIWEIFYGTYPYRKPLSVTNTYAGPIKYRLFWNDSYSAQDSAYNIYIPAIMFMNNITTMLIAPAYSYTQTALNYTHVPPLANITGTLTNYQMMNSSFVMPGGASIYGGRGYYFKTKIWQGRNLNDNYNISSSIDDGNTWLIENNSAGYANNYYTTVTFGDTIYHIGGNTLKNVTLVSSNGKVVTIANTSSFNADPPNTISATNRQFYAGEPCTAFHDKIYCYGGSGNNYLTDFFVGTPTGTDIIWARANISMRMPDRAPRLYVVGDKLFYLSGNTTYYGRIYEITDPSNGVMVLRADRTSSVYFGSDLYAGGAVSVEKSDTGYGGSGVVVFSCDNITYSNDGINFVLLTKLATTGNNQREIAFNPMTNNVTVWGGSTAIPISKMANSTRLEIPLVITGDPLSGADVVEVIYNKPAASTDTQYIYFGNTSMPVMARNTSALTGFEKTGAAQPVQTNSTIPYLRNNVTATLNGYFLTVDAPESGATVAVGSVNNISAYIVSETGGFTSVFSQTSSAGLSRDVAAADAATYVAENRLFRADIYDVLGTLKGTYATGGEIRSVDVSQKNGLYVIAGGDDGKMYIFSKDAASAWYVYFQGDSMGGILSTSSSWRGEYAAAGRSDGSLDYYNLQIISASEAMVNFKAMKSGVAYANTPITVYHSVGYPYSWDEVSSGITDSVGSYTVDATVGEYYRVVINSGEAEQIFSIAYNKYEYYVIVPWTAPIQSKIDYWSTLDTPSLLLTMYYNDTSNQTTSVRWVVKNNTNLFYDNTTVYAGVPLYDMPHILDWPNQSYVITMTADRPAGDIRTTFVHSMGANVTAGNKLPAWLDEDSRNIILYLIIVFIGGLFSYLGGPVGAVIVSITAGALCYWGWGSIDPKVLMFVIVWAFLGLLGRKSADY